MAPPGKTRCSRHDGSRTDGNGHPDTRFGQILVLQALAIACALAAVWRGRDILAASLACTAVILEAGHSHAFAMAHIPVLLSQMLHLTAAGAWLGGLLPLLVVV